MGVACQTWARCGMALRACTPSGAHSRHAAACRGAPRGPGLPRRAPPGARAPAVGRARAAQLLAAGQLLGLPWGAAGAMGAFVISSPLEMLRSAKK